MFPIGDDRDAGGSAPLVVIGLIALNVLAFLLELAQPSQGALQSFIQAWGVVPHEYVVRHDLPPTIPIPFWSTLFTSMFLHAGWMHLGGNMLYLWIFGDNLEGVMGHGRFIIFYLVSVASLTFTPAETAALSMTSFGPSQQGDKIDRRHESASRRQAIGLGRQHASEEQPAAARESRRRDEAVAVPRGHERARSDQMFPAAHDEVS